MTDVVVQDKDVIVEVSQPTIPPYVPPPKIGLVEINQVVQRGTAWLTGQGPPSSPGGQYGDMYLDANTGDMYQWNGVGWDYIGTFAPSTLTGAEILAELITVDGAGSALDADLLDGQHGTYYATATGLAAEKTRNDTQDGQIAANGTNITNNFTAIQNLQTSDASQNTAITNIQNKDTAQDSHLATIDADQITQNNRLTAVESKNTAQDTAISGKEPTIVAGNPLYFWAGDKTWKPVPPAGVPEAPNDGTQYVRQSLSWQPVVVPPGTYVADSPPASPAPNQLWWKSNLGQLFIYYLDPGGAPAQWVQAAGSATGQVRNTARSRNRVNNPTAQISQENGTTAVTTSGAYPADQWYFGAAGIVASAQKTTGLTTPEGTNLWVGIGATTAKASLAASDILQLILPIEGNDVADLAWGTAQAKPVVFRFAAICDVIGTFGFTIHNSAANRSYCGLFTITTAGAVQVFSFTIPGDTTGTWVKDTGIGMMIRIVPAAASNLVGIAGWQAGAMFVPPGCTNMAAATSRLYITDVGLYADPDGTGLPPPFVAPAYEDDLARCKRYWQSTTIGNRAAAAGVQNWWTTLNFMGEMRVQPSASGVIGSRLNVNSFTLVPMSAWSAAVEMTSAAAGDCYVLNENWRLNARLI